MKKIIMFGIVMLLIVLTGCKDEILQDLEGLELMEFTDVFNCTPSSQLEKGVYYLNWGNNTIEDKYGNIVCK